MLARLARLGYFAKAVVYLIVGMLACLSAFGAGGRVTDTSGALKEILEKPFGLVMLVVLAVGFCGYAVWRVLDAWFDPDRRGRSVKGLTIRIGNVVRGVIYGALGIEAFRLAQGMHLGSRGEAEMLTAHLLALPLGQWLVALIAVWVVVFGLTEILSALKSEVHGTLDLSPVPRRLRGPALHVSRFGVGVRGVIIVVLGVFLFRAALQHDPSEAAGTRESMLELAQMSRWLLAAIGAGLIAYAIDQALHARCRRIKPVI